MQRLVYLISYPFLWCIASLPFRLFYLFSDLIFALLFYIVGYRRKVVQANLELVFSDLSPDEISKIEKEFYRHMCDVFLETIKTMKIGRKDFIKRYQLINVELLQEIERDKSVMVLIPHYGNWEWSIVTNLFFESQGYAVYQKIGNKYFDAMIKRIRAKWNTALIHQKEMVRIIIRNQQAGTNAVYGVVSDQSPQSHRTRYWRSFMGITVPVFDSPELLARKFDLAVVFAKISKLKRGHYQLEFVPITKSASETQEHEITDQFLRMTENSIGEQPAYYLWTHRRWKHRDKVPSEFQEK
ncbi:MAG: lysophospholipid acyltransferase family protein [Flavobacteriaceae bacterium]